MKRLRNFIAHLEDYAIGEGWLQAGNPPVLEDKYPAPFLGWVMGGSTLFSIGDAHVSVEDAARRVIDLAELVERVRARHLDHVEKEAQAELRRRWERDVGEPPPD